MAILGVEGVDGGDATADFLSEIVGCMGMGRMKGGSVGILELDAIADDPKVAEAVSKKSAILEATIEV